MESLDILETLCRQPTVSYHESRVAMAIMRICEQHGIVAQADRWGNLVVDLPGKEIDAQPIAYVAHMDHPGFEALGDNGDGTIKAISHGGMAPSVFDVGTEVKVIQAATDRTNRIDAEVISCESFRTSPDGRFASAESVTIEPSEHIDQFPAPIILDLPDFELDGGLIKARALDDLAGCATILSALIETAQSMTNPSRVLGIFTRAEEVGLVGARLIAEEGTVPREAHVVSIETSLKSSEARQGEGVVIRVGDRSTTFDNSAEGVLRGSAERLNAQGREGFRAQRALMGAGGCEASAFAAHGYSVTGTSYPLGAWHNREEDGSIAAEYISLDDFNSGVDLITASMSHPRSEVLHRNPLAEHPEQEAERLKMSADGYWQKRT